MCQFDSRVRLFELFVILANILCLFKIIYFQNFSNFGKIFSLYQIFDFSNAAIRLLSITFGINILCFQE